MAPLLEIKRREQSVDASQVFITPLPMLRFMEKLGDPTLKTLTKAVDTMRDSMLEVIHVSPPLDTHRPGPACLGHCLQRFQRDFSPLGCICNDEMLAQYCSYRWIASSTYCSPCTLHHCPRVLKHSIGAAVAAEAC